MVRAFVISRTVSFTDEVEHSHASLLWCFAMTMTYYLATRLETPMTGNW